MTLHNAKLRERLAPCRVQSLRNACDRRAVCRQVPLIHQRLCKTPKRPCAGLPNPKLKEEQRAIDFARTWTIEVIGPSPIARIERRTALSRDVPGIERLMSFTVYGKNPCGGHSEFERVTAAGAVFKAADLVGDGWSGVHISDAKNKIYWPARFNRIPDRFSHVAVVRKPNT